MMKLGEATKANIPGVGKVNVLSPVAWIQLLFGGVILLVLWPIANRFAGAISSKIPQGPKVSSSDSPGYVILGN